MAELEKNILSYGKRKTKPDSKLGEKFKYRYGYSGASITFPW